MPAPSRFTVLHYTGCDDDPGGIFTVIRNLAAAGRFDCLVGVNRGCVQYRKPPLPAVEFPRLKPETISATNALHAWHAARAIRHWLRESPNRIFHGHTRAGLLVALWLNAMGEKRVVVSVHCYGRQRWFYRWAQRRLGGRLFWLSPAMRAYYNASGSDWDRCVPACVQPSSLPPRQAQAGRLHLAGVGGVLRWKRWELVIKAMAQLAPHEIAGVRFTHIGGGDEAYRAELRQLAIDSGIADRVEFRGVTDSSETLLAESDVLVVASHNEPFSVALMEALAAGRPVMASDSGGTVDVIQPGVNGWLFRDGDADALAACMREWLAGAHVFNGEAIRRTAFYADDVAARWEAIYAAL